MSYSQIVVNRIKQLCLDKGITANLLAIISGVAQSTLKDITRGVTKDLRITVLHKIASAFGIQHPNYWILKNQMSIHMRKIKLLRK